MSGLAAAPPPMLLAWLLPGCAALAAVLTALALWYAHRAALLDQPGTRRSHVVATPRGGGAGPVLAWLATLVLIAPLAQLPDHWIALALGTALVAVIGAIDDHRPLSPWPRLGVHAGAAALLVGSAWGMPQALPALLLSLAGVFWLVTAVNVWNFMDGIDGLVASQTAWVALVLSAVAGWAGHWPLALASGVLLAAVSGFLPFNAPRARIFLGDVGSGALGFIAGGLLLLAWQARSVDAAVLALLPSALLIDAGLTLASRIGARRRWYTAHREHLYQWLVRRGLSHARVVMLYLSWNVLVVTPLTLAVLWHRLDPVIALLVAYLGGALLWMSSRRVLLARARRYGGAA